MPPHSAPLFASVEKTKWQRSDVSQADSPLHRQDCKRPVRLRLVRLALSIASGVASVERRQWQSSDASQADSPLGRPGPKLCEGLRLARFNLTTDVGIQAESHKTDGYQLELRQCSVLKFVPAGGCIVLQYLL